MATAEEILAKVTANTEVLRGVAIIADTLNGEHASIEEAIADLKAQIEAGTPPDFTALDAAVDEQGTVIEGMSAAIAAPKPPVEPPPVEE